MMNLTRLREDLGQYLHSHQDGHHELDQLLNALEKKDAALQRQLEAEQEPQKRHHLEIELQVTRAQLNKGLEMRDGHR